MGHKENNIDVPIKSIEIKNMATFNLEGAKLENLSKVNLIYGSNGSGKTTITRLLNNDLSSDESKVIWNKNNKLKTEIYNIDFVNSCINEPNGLRGIYTFGKDSKISVEEINKNEQEIKNLTSKISEAENNIRKKEEENNKKTQESEEALWEQKPKQGKPLYECFKGFHGSKSDLLDRSQEYIDSQSEKTFETLVIEYDDIYKDKHQNIEIVSINSELFNQINVDDSILKIPIIGSNSVFFGKLIEKLGNSDWVRNGIIHLEHNNEEKCPFCQTEIDKNSVLTNIKEVFNDNYKAEINKVEKFKENYDELKKTFIDYINNLINQQNKYLTKDVVKDFSRTMISLIDYNINIINDKLSNPSKELKMSELSNEINRFEKYLENVNQNINQHNDDIRNLEGRKKELTKEGFIYITNQVKKILVENNLTISENKKGIEGLNTTINTHKSNISELTHRNNEERKKLANVRESIESINEMLISFGIENFSLEIFDEIYYKIKRENGEEAAKTISEGEKTFLSFLYFYNKVNGGDTPENINEDKVIVIDDPVSSLDSNFFYIIINLINKLYNILFDKNEDAQNETKQKDIKQIFILTHNTVFFKYVSEYFKNKVDKNNIEYYIVRKNNKISNIENYKDNPISTSHSLLWKDLQKDDLDSVTMQNSMRRLLEFYCNLFGFKKIEEIKNEFEGGKSIIVHSLIKYIHVGSHEILDEEYLPLSADSSSQYKEVFKEVFDKLGLEELYKKQMEI